MIRGVLAWFADPAHWQGPDGVPVRVLQHLGYCGLAVLCAGVIAVPLGLYVGHSGRGGVVLVGVSNAMRALPTLGLITFLFLLISGSEVATVIGLVVLAVPSILAGAYAGVANTSRDALDAARGMGMTGWQRLWQVEVPSAVPLLLGGVRDAVLQLVATAAVAAYVGLGGLGRFVLDGLAILNYSEVVAGAVLTAALAVVLDLALAGLRRVCVPAGLRQAVSVGGGHSRRRVPARREG